MCDLKLRPGLPSRHAVFVGLAIREAKLHWPQLVTGSLEGFQRQRFQETQLLLHRRLHLCDQSLAAANELGELGTHLCRWCSVL